METIIYDKAERKVICDRITGAGGPLAAATLKLFTTNVTVGPDMTLGDFDEPSFTGYAPVGPLVWGPAYIDESGRAIQSAGCKQFTCTSAPVQPETVYGYFLTTGAGPFVLAGAVRFAQPVSVSRADQAIHAEPVVVVG